MEEVAFWWSFSTCKHPSAGDTSCHTRSCCLHKLVWSYYHKKDNDTEFLWHLLVLCHIRNVELYTQILGKVWLCRHQNSPIWYHCWIGTKFCTIHIHCCRWGCCFRKPGCKLVGILDRYTQPTHLGPCGIRPGGCNSAGHTHFPCCKLRCGQQLGLFLVCRNPESTEHEYITKTCCQHNCWNIKTLLKINSEVIFRRIRFEFELLS